MSRDDGIIGVSDHGGWAVLVTVAGDGTLLDRRRVELVDEDLPKIPHHSEGQALPLHEAVALVERMKKGGLPDSIRVGTRSRRTSAPRWKKKSLSAFTVAWGTASPSLEYWLVSLFYMFRETKGTA